MRKLFRLFPFPLICSILVSLFFTGTAWAADEDGYKVTFQTDAHLSVTVSKTQSFEDKTLLTENATEGYARDSATGEIDTSGSGQINFLVIPEDGYAVDSVNVTGTYKSLKSGTDGTGYENGYRITKIESSLTVTITEKAVQTSEDDETISHLVMNDGAVTSVQLSSDKTYTGAIFTAVYDTNGRLVDIALSDSLINGAYNLSKKLSFDKDTQSMKCFLCDTGFLPLGKVYTYNSEADTGDGVIHLNNSGIDAGGVTGVNVNGTTVTITQAGEYYLTGTLEDGQINVALPSKADEVTLHLTDVNVTSSTGNPFNATLGCVTLANTEGSSSSFISTFGNDSDTGVGIYSKNDLSIKGEDNTSTITVKSTYGNAIRCKADLEIGTGNLEVEAGNNGIKGDESVKITKKAGTITVNATGDSIKTDAISDTELEYGKGNITINGGTLELTAGGDGIQADDTVTINGGTLNIHSTTEGIKANTVNVTTTDENNITTPVEGNIEITGGTITIDSEEDGMKAAGHITISGGTVTVISELDGIQSGVDYTDESQNTLYSTGDLTISGGTVNVTSGGGSSAGQTGDDSCKGIKAYTNLTVSGGEITVNSYDDAVHANYSVAITGGTLELSSADDGIHADYKLTLGTDDGTDSDYKINVLTSYEGLEASLINYLSGTTYLYTTDDGVNAAGDYTEDGTLNTNAENTLQSFAAPPSGNRPGGFDGGPGGGQEDNSSNGMLYIKGGKLYVLAKGDGIDSNGNISMSGGVVVVNGASSGGNGVFDKGDSGNCTFTITGGTLVGFGTSDMTVYPTAANGYYSSTSLSLTAGKAISVSTDSGSLIIVPEMTMSRALLYVTCEEMAKSKTYSVSTNATTTDAEEILVKEKNSVRYGLFKK